MVGTVHSYEEVGAFAVPVQQGTVAESIHIEVGEAYMAVAGPEASETIAEVDTLPVVFAVMLHKALTSMLEEVALQMGDAREYGH